jgi:hypothetical protein
MDFIPEVLGWHANVWLGHRQTGGAGEDAHVAVSFGRVGIQFDAGTGLSRVDGTA